MKIFQPSKFQSAIFAFIKKAIDASERFFLLIRAVAGSGKTTTLVELLSRVPSGFRVIVLAFGKAIADEVDSKTPKNVEGATFHRVGYRLCRKRFGRSMRMMGGKGKIPKITKILWDMFPKIEDKPHPDYLRYGRFVSRLVDLARAEGIGTILCADTLEAWQALVDHHDLQLESKTATMAKAIEIARDVLTESNKRALKGIIDFADQLYLPILLDIPFDTYDLVLVDEYQDTNQVRKEFVKRLLKPTGSVVAVGDDKQAIMGFTGADARAMEDFDKDFPGSTLLPLSISYRISKAGARLAQSIVPGIMAADDAPEGKVETLSTYAPNLFQPSDAVICRNVAPLVAMAYSFILKGIGCKILGREIGTGLVQLVERMEAEGINHLLDKLDEYQAREVEKATKRDDSMKAESICDVCDCVRIICDTLKESERTIAGLVAKISSLFSDDKGKDLLTLCTIHKAKGLEWERVFILDVDRIPSKYATKEWQLEQETNLLYVAYTRAKLETYIIASGKWDGERSQVVAKRGAESETSKAAVTMRDVEEIRANGDAWDTDKMLA